MALPLLITLYLTNTPAKLIKIKPFIKTGDGHTIRLTGTGVDELPVSQIDSAVIDMVSVCCVKKEDISFF